MLLRFLGALKLFCFTLFIWGLALVGVNSRAATISATPIVRLGLGSSEVIALQVNASGINMEYQWYRGLAGDTSQPVVGANNDLLVSPLPTAPTRFWVRVTDVNGSIDSVDFQVSGPLATPGTYFSVGSNSFGRLGDGTTISRSAWFQGQGGIVSIAGGGAHTLFLKTDGSLWATGYNGKGQLGDSSVINRSSPVQIATGVASIAAGDSHSLFIKTDGTLWAMGDNSFGQLGMGAFDAIAHPTPVLIASAVLSISAGARHSLFVKTDGSLWAMGSNLWGQLGNGTNVSVHTPTHVGDEVVSVAAGSDHSLFIKANRSLWSMGLNTSGQLGIGIIDPSEKLRGTPTQVATDVASVSASEHTVFVKLDGSLWVMGKNNSGQLGEGSYTYRSLPLQIDTNVLAASAGNSHTMFLKADHSLWVMGNNFYGQLGDGSTSASLVPRRISTGVLALSAGGAHSLVIRSPYTVTFDLGTHGNRIGGGQEIQPVFGETAATPPIVSAVAGWGFVGWNTAFSYITADITVTAVYEAVIAPQIASQPVSPGQNPPGLAVLKVETTGNYLEYQWYRGSPGDISQPVAGATGPLLVQPRLTTMTSVWVRVTNSVGSADSAAVELEGVAAPAGSLFSVGRNFDGQLGNGSTTDQALPVWIRDEVVSVSANGSHSLFLKSDASLWVMGNNSSGQLGDGTTTDRITPVNIANEVTSMAAGSGHVFFFKTNGSLWGSGSNSYGQLGIGSGSSQLTPVPISNVNAMACAGDSHSLFLKVDGSLWSVGRNNYGQLGDGTTTDRAIPVKIADGVLFAATGNSQTFFIKIDGTLWASGQNDRGQLGTGSVDSGGIATPVQIATSVATIVSGYRHSLFIKQDGSLWGMGDNSYGQLGREDITSYQSAPIQLVADGVTRIAARNDHSFYLKSDGSLWAMGLNFYGELGDGSALTARRTPIQIALGVIDVSTGSSHSLAIGSPRTVIFDLGSHGTVGGGGPLTQTVLRGSGAVAPSVIASAGWGFAGWNYSFAQVDSDITVSARYEAALSPAITSPPELIRAGTGAPHALRVSASGNFLTYQWYRGASGDTGQPVAGANREVLVPTPFFSSTRFWVRVSNSAGSVDSQALLVEPQSASSARPSSLFASGSNTYGQIGDGTTTARYTPVSVNTDCVSVSAGVSHSLFIKPDGSLWAMGRNHKGQLGDGTTTSRNIPVKIADGVRSAATGLEHSVFIKTDGSLWGMGSTSSGQLGTGAYTTALRTTPILIASEVASVSANAGATLFVKLDGTLWGTGSSLSTPSPIQLAAGIASIKSSDDHLLYVKTDGSLWVRGSNVRGQLGGGLPFGIYLSTFTPVDDGILAVAAGASHSLLLKFDGTLLTTGYNNAGQLGDGTRTSTNMPIPIANDVTAIAAGSQHTLYRKADGSLWAAGDNSGLSFVITSRWPSPTLLFPRVNTFAAGGANSLIVRSNQLVTFDLGAHGTRIGGGALSQWVISGDDALPPKVTGTPEWGFAGWDVSFSNITADTALTARYEAVVVPVADVGPVRVDSGTNGPLALQINAVGYYLTYQWYRGTSGDVSQPIAGATSALLVSNRLTTYTSYWVRVSNNVGSTDSPALSVDAAINTHSDLFTTGSNAYGQLGDGSLTSRSTPGKIASDVTAVSAGDFHSLFLGADGSLWAMGGNASGQLGDGSTTNRTTPVQVGTDVVNVSAGGSHSLFLKSNGTLWAMGLNTYGQLGDGSTTTRTLPVLVASNVAWMVAGLNNHSLFLKRDGTLWGMGSNLFGKLGLGVSDNRAHPVPLQIDTDVIAASSGDSHSLYLKRDGSLWGMGLSSSGQLAIPAPDNVSYIPILISTGVRAIAAGGSHSLFIKTDGSLWGIGANSSGQLGSTDILSKSSPIQIATGVKSVHAGQAHSFFVKIDGSLWAMGRNTSGELGNGSILNQMTPAQNVARINGVSAGDTHSLLLVPLPVENTFASWIAATGISGVYAAPDADPDADGVPNLLEYTYGTNPLLNNVPASLPFAAVETINNEQFLSFTHRRRKVSGLTYTYRISDNLNTPTVWTPVTVIPSVINADVDGDGLIELVTVSVPLGTTPRLFLTLKVQE